MTVNTNLLASADAQEQVRLALSAGGDSPYDIVHGANAQVGEWAGSGWMMPLNDLVDKYWDEYNLGDIPEKAWEGTTIDGQIYGVPIVGNTLHLIYRQDVFDELGLDVPDTYDEVIEVCNAIGLDNPDWDMPFTINLSAGWAWEIEFFQMLRAYGGDFLNEDNMPPSTARQALTPSTRSLKLPMPAWASMAIPLASTTRKWRCSWAPCLPQTSGPAEQQT